MTEPPAPGERSHWAEKLAERRASHRARSRLYRIMVVLAGVIVTLIGIAMLVLPGPALIVIPVGLAMLAMEFTWAENALEKALTQAEKAQATAKEATPMQKAFSVVAVVLGIAAAIAAIILWDVPVFPDN